MKIITKILNKDGRILLSTINYKPGSMSGPPYCISPEDIQKYFGNLF